MLRLVIWPSTMLLGWTETKLSTLKYGSKSIQTSLILRKRPPKPYKLLKFFISFVITVKSCHAPSIWKKMRWKSICLLILKSITEIIKYFKSLYDFGGRCLKIEDVCMDFELYFKVHNLASVHPKSVILGQMTNLNMVFDMVVSVYRLVLQTADLQTCRLADLQTCRLADLESQHTSSSYPKSFLKCAQPAHFFHFH